VCASCVCVCVCVSVCLRVCPFVLLGACLGVSTSSQVGLLAAALRDPLDALVAQTEGSLGAVLEVSLRNAGASRSVDLATVLSFTEVSATDPAFTNPCKRIGAELTDLVEAEREGWTVVKTGPHSYRRVVASPEPLRIVQQPAIEALLDAGMVVIAVGGGGVPVVADPADGTLVPVQAVVDKDLASALLADALGCRLLVLATDTPVLAGFGTAGARSVGATTPRLLAKECGAFEAGTMGPKVEAATRFVEQSGAGAGGPSVRRRAAIDRKARGHPRARARRVRNADS